MPFALCYFFLGFVIPFLVTPSSDIIHLMFALNSLFVLSLLLRTHASLPKVAYEFGSVRAQCSLGKTCLFFFLTDSRSCYFIQTETFVSATNGYQDLSKLQITNFEIVCTPELRRISSLLILASFCNVEIVAKLAHCVFWDNILLMSSSAMRNASNVVKQDKFQQKRSGQLGSGLYFLVLYYSRENTELWILGK
jgi:hypothetical protein